MQDQGQQQKQNKKKEVCKSIIHLHFISSSSDQQVTGSTTFLNFALLGYRAFLHALVGPVLSRDVEDTKANDGCTLLRKPLALLPADERGTKQAMHFKHCHIMLISHTADVAEWLHKFKLHLGVFQMYSTVLLIFTNSWCSTQTSHVDF